jgi:glycosyltransferase involved in cell wall biosynthesis
MVTTSPIGSVIIPTRNEEAFIDRCLQSVFSSDPVPGGLEVLVVDGMSTDRTRQILADWCQKQPSLKILDNPSGIVPRAMNIGITAARGQWIIRLDAHSEYPANYFNLCIETSQRTGADNVGGGVVTLVRGNGWSGKAVRALTTHSFGVGNSSFRIGAAAGWVDTVPFGCYRRGTLERTGMYDERLVRNQDFELNRRLHKNGGRIWYDPSIQALYYNQSSLRGLFRQAFNTGKWNPWMWFVAPYSFMWRHAVPMVFVSALIFGFSLSLISPIMGILTLMVTLVPYFLLNLRASLQQCYRYGLTILPGLPLLFLFYHIVYGIGGLWGLFLLLLGRASVQVAS